MSDKTSLEITDLLRQYIEALVEEVVLEGKPFDDQKKRWLQRYCQEEGLDHETLEGNLFQLFDIAVELKTLGSKTLQILFTATAQECLLSEEETDKLINHLEEQRTTTNQSTESGEATTYEEVKIRLMMTRREKEHATASAEAARHDRLESENLLKAEQESLDKTLRSADSDAVAKVKNDLKKLQEETVVSKQREVRLENELEEATRQQEAAQRTFEQNRGPEEKERKKTIIAVAITCAVMAALYVAFFLYL